MTEEGLSVIIGFVMPMVVDFARNKLHAHGIFAYAVTIVSTVVVSAAIALVDGSISLDEDLFVILSIVFATSQTTYNTWWKYTNKHENVLNN